MENPRTDLLGPRVLGIGVSGKTCGFVVLEPWAIRHLEVRTLRHLNDVMATLRTVRSVRSVARDEGH